MRGKRISFLPVFIMGILFGIIMVFIGKSTFVDYTGLLDEGTLLRIRDCHVDKGAFFSYLLFRRFKNVFLLILLATTYLGVFVCLALPFLLGASYGLFLGIAVFRYGLQGVIICGAGLFPQVLFYFPAIILLLKWCENLSRKIYFQKEIRVEKGFLFHTETIQFMIRILIACLLVFVGCALEGYLSVSILQNLLILYS